MAEKMDIPSFKDAAKLAKGGDVGPVVTPPEPPAEIDMANPAPVAPPVNLFAGTAKKLEVFGKPGTDPKDPIPGYQLFWMDDIEGGLLLSQALASGWQYVEKDEIALNDAPASPGNTDVGNHVRRWVGHGADDRPIYSYLMKKPNWLHELHMTGPDSIEQRVHMKQEEQLMMGTLNVNPNDRPYTARTPYPGTRSGLPPISIGRYYKPPSR